jgi:hypothetical protein
VFNKKFKKAGKSVTVQLQIVQIFTLVPVDSYLALQNFVLFAQLKAFHTYSTWPRVHSAHRVTAARLLLVVSG